ncbi:unnamed protein product [Prunus armeniaca]|uniref:Arginase n=1 Tax=Prunus armeniaca TaxID=36596 RepID=A0A6J5WL98_PRUAR|nr:unnamed protein product [Prunus armeniaca]
MNIHMQGELVRALGSAVASTSLLGVPLGHNSSFLQGPTILRVKVVGIRSINKEGPEQGKRSGLYLSIDVDEPGGLSFHDVLNILHSLQGDVFAADVVEFNPQRYTVDGMTAMVAAKLLHLIPYPVVRALSETLGGPVVDILHLDAHPDIYKAFEGNEYSHASSFARIWKVVMLGSFCRLVLDQSTKKGVNKENDLALNNMKCEPFQEIVMHFSEMLVSLLPPSVPVSCKLGEGVKGVYILIDVDCLDPAFAPGVSHIEPGVFPSVMFSTYSTASKATLLLQMSLNSTRSATLLMG